MINPLSKTVNVSAHIATWGYSQQLPMCIFIIVWPRTLGKKV